MRSVPLAGIVATACAVAWAGGWLPGGIAAVAVGWAGALGWRGWRVWRRDASRWPEPVLRRGSHPGRAGLLMDVAAGEGNAAVTLADHVATSGVRMTCFVAAGDGLMAEKLGARGHEVAWLGLPTARRLDATPLPAGVVVRGAPSLRVRYWRPVGAGPTAAELELARILGFRLVAPTVTIGLDADPDGRNPVATDIVRVPVGLAPARLASWLGDAERRAIELVPVSAVG